MIPAGRILLRCGPASWVTYKFTERFYENADAGRWASALAITGAGFVFHSFDLSAHLLLFVSYMAGALIIYESGVWRE